MLILDQGPAGLATGDSHTYEINNLDGQRSNTCPCRSRWRGRTRPAIPPPPSSSSTASNSSSPISDTGQPVVYYGNDIAGGNIYNTPEAATNAPNLDSINNVENVFIQPLLGTKYSSPSSAASVNVNAVTAQPNNVVQDYALVISCGNGESPMRSR